MLPIEGVLALNHTDVMRNTESLRSFDQGSGDLKVRDRRILDRGVLTARAVHAHRSCRHNDISALHLRLHASACAHADKCVSAASHKLLKSDCGGRAADAGRRDGHSLAGDGACVSDVFPVVRDEDRIVKILCNLRAPLRVARQDDDLSDLPGCHLNVILLFFVCRIVDHLHLRSSLSIGLSYILKS